MRPNIPAKCVIDRFVEYHRRPFTVKDVANDTGLHTKTVRNLLPQLVREGRIRVMLREPSGTIYGKVPVTQNMPTGKRSDWTPRMDKLQHFYDLVAKHPHIDDIRKHTPYSQETVYRYLRILVIDGCLKKLHEIYKQVEFKPTYRPWSAYKGTSQQLSRFRMNEREKIIKEIQHDCERKDLELPEFDENTPIKKLKYLRDRCFYLSYGLGGYDQG